MKVLLPLTLLLPISKYTTLQLTTYNFNASSQTPMLASQADGSMYLKAIDPSNPCPARNNSALSKMRPT
jgi:hypothetical protein